MNNQTEIFRCPESWLEKSINVTLVGVGGSGSNVFDALCQLHHGLLGVGHPYGLSVTVFDDDSVDLPNIGRQRFAPSDVGQNKAITLVNRYNLAYGLNWESRPVRFEAKSFRNNIPDLLITCVDTISTRKEIANFVRKSKIKNKNVLWQDYGNGLKKGQTIIGNLYNCKNKLPNVYDLYNELEVLEEDNEPSCSLAEAIQSQDLYINRCLADAGVNILWQLLRTGEIDHHGVFIDLKTSENKPLKINKDVWEFMGYTV